MRSAAALSAFVAATRAAAPAAVRHLEYAFSSFSSAQVSAGTTGELSGPGTGTLTVDLTGAPDGTTLVRAQEWWWHEPRPEQAVACVLRPSGDLRCDQYPLIDAAEYVLLPMFSPVYFGGILAAPAARHTFTVVLPRNYYSFAWSIDLSLGLGHIQLNGSSHIIGGPLERERLIGSVRLGGAGELPLDVHADLTVTSLSDIMESQSIEAKLTNDSAASASGSPPARHRRHGRLSMPSAPPACSRRAATGRGSYTYR